MTDGSRGGRPEEGSPEYTWLYGSPGGGAASGSASGQGSGQGAPPPPPDDDRTRMMPAAPSYAAPPPSGQPPGPRGPGGPTGPAAPPPGRTARRRRRLPGLRWVLAALLAWIVYLVGVPLYAWTTTSEVDHEPAGDRPGEQPGTTYLVVGSDSREGLSAAERRRLTTGDAGGRRTDTIMLLHTGDGPNLLASVPRDSIVEVPGYGTTKVNAAYAFGGPKLLVRTLEQNTGIRIDHYVEIGFGGFVQVVDALGGVEICPTMDMRDPLAGLDVEEGCQEADGATALGYARSRKLYTARGDVDRARAQREVVSEVGRGILSPWTVLNPVRYWRVVNAGAESVRVSEGSSAFSMGRFAMAMNRVDGDAGLTCGVPIQDLAVTWDPDRSKRFFRAIIEDDTDAIGRELCTPSGLPR